MAMTSELMGPGFFVFFHQEVELSGALGRAGQARRAREKDIKEDDDEFMKLIAESLPGILKYLGR